MRRNFIYQTTATATQIGMASTREFKNEDSGNYSRGNHCKLSNDYSIRSKAFRPNFRNPKGTKTTSFK